VAEATIPAASQYKNDYPSDLISTDLGLTMKAAIRNSALNIVSVPEVNVNGRPDSDEQLLKEELLRSCKFRNKDT
jgi:hypothetical protein